MQVDGVRDRVQLCPAVPKPVKPRVKTSAIEKAFMSAHGLGRGRGDKGKGRGRLALTDIPAAVLEPESIGYIEGSGLRDDAADLFGRGSEAEDSSDAEHTGAGTESSDAGSDQYHDITPNASDPEHSPSSDQDEDVMGPPDPVAPPAVTVEIVARPDLIPAGFKDVFVVRDGLRTQLGQCQPLPMTDMCRPGLRVAARCDLHTRCSRSKTWYPSTPDSDWNEIYDILSQWLLAGDGIVATASQTATVQHMRGVPRL